MSKSFTFEQKRKLTERIHNLNVNTNKKELQFIKNYITENNPELFVMKNGNGYFMQFQNLNYKTYEELTKFLDKLDKKKAKEIESEMLENSELLSEEITALTDNISERQHLSKKLRLTNTESHILNRVKYENELKKNETNCENEITYFNSENMKKKNNDPPKNKDKTSDIFVKTKK